MTFASFFLLCALQTLIGLLVDHLFGDPVWFPHPARGVGRVITVLERLLRRRFTNLRLAGAILCATTICMACLCAAGIMIGLHQLDAWFLPVGRVWFASGWRSTPWFSLLGGGLICGMWFSWRSLGDEAAAVWRCLMKNDLPAGRKTLSMIVGRDTASLDEAGVARATVETVAENSVDGGLAPVFFALLGGPICLTIYKAASTLDSMVGYKNERYMDMGMVSARLDDALNFMPARIALALVPLAAILAALNPMQSLRIGLRDHSRHQSPNSGWPESLFAGALETQLGGAATYNGIASEKPLLGEPARPMTAQRITDAIRLLQAMAALCAMATAPIAAVARHCMG